MDRQDIVVFERLDCALSRRSANPTAAAARAILSRIDFVYRRRIDKRGAMKSIATLQFALIGLAVLISGQATLGLLGLLQGPASGVLLLGTLFSAATLGIRAGFLSPRRRFFNEWSPLEAGLAVSIASVLTLGMWTGVGRGSFFYDTISYHLHFPAAWMHSGRLEIVPTVFGDIAPAYNPSNVELILHALMAPLGSDYLAHCVQVPFAGIAALAIFATSKELGASRRAGLAAALSFLLLPEVWVQTRTALVDLALAALFLTTLPFLIRLWHSPSRMDVVALLLAFGMFLGTKFLALAYSLPPVAIGIAILWRHRQALPGPWTALAWLGFAIASVGATGGFWYVRNFVAAGNPVFPLEVKVAGIEILHGLYDTALMRRWDYHHPVGDLRSLFQMLLGRGGVAFAVAAAVALVVRRRGPELALAAVLLAIFWYTVPYQHSRFLFPFFGVVTIAMARAARSARTGSVCFFLLLGTIAGSLAQWPSVDRIAAIAVGFFGALLPSIERRIPLRPVALTAAIGLAWLLGSGLEAHRAHGPTHRGAPEFQHAWSWLHENIQDAHVAYTGLNLPFPLYGRNLGNRVTYVNVALGPYARVDVFHPRAPVTNAEPAVYREGANLESWLHNLRALGCNSLFIYSLDPIVKRNIAHDSDGFPIERAWADALPEIFRLRYQNPRVRIYDIAARI